MYYLFAVLVMFVTFLTTHSAPVTTDKKSPVFHTSVERRNATEPSATIALQVLDKPHHLFIGRCNPDDDILHGENIILNNDGKSHVSATIRIDVEGPVYISCVKILDQVPGGEGGYPSYLDGGVGQNFVSFLVTTHYGKGFDFYIQILGYTSNKEENN